MKIPEKRQPKQNPPIDTIAQDPNAAKLAAFETALLDWEHRCNRLRAECETNVAKWAGTVAGYQESYALVEAKCNRAETRALKAEAQGRALAAALRPYLLPSTAAESMLELHE